MISWSLSDPGEPGQDDSADKAPRDDPLELLESPRDEEPLPAADVSAEDDLNARWKHEIAKHKVERLKLVELVYVVPLPNKSQAPVQDAIALVMTQIESLGYPIRRLHTDRGREFCNARLRAYCARRGVHKTTGDADDFKSNGRVEGAVSRIKQVTRSLLIDQHLGREYWPLAMLHAAARLRQKALQRVGYHSPPSVLPFGTNVHIKRRSWDRRKDRWSSKTLVGRVVCPSSEVVKGHLVLLESGEIVITSALVTEVKPDSAEVFHVDDPGEVKPAPNASSGSALLSGNARYVRDLWASSV